MAYTYKEEFIRFMVDNGVLKFGQFTLKSGRLAPYFINTGMFDGVKSSFFSILEPEKTSRKILRAIERNTDFRGLPWSYHFFRLCQGLLPVSWFDTIVGNWLGIYSAMDNFTGRKK